MEHVCQGKLMAPSIRILETPLMIPLNDPLEEERNCLYIDEDKPRYELGNNQIAVMKIQ